MDEIDIISEPEVVYHSKSNKKTEKLIDRFVLGEENRYTINAAYIIRDKLKQLGPRKSSQQLLASSMTI